MLRRTFLSSTAASMAYDLSAQSFDVQKKRRVGMIGSGWYGKSDILRLVQIAPVEIVSICDVDKVMLEKAADLIASRQISKKRPRLFTDYRKMLAEKDLDLVEIATPDHWHALPMIEAARAG
ncbi:MAG: Gfo/Idh/MocA family oxidoreductase, partial [Acidobacteria bacterium]|nr:Gfo/Idh/MocA family oxidoreductase [Acidobacteriota bacterium]